MIESAYIRACGKRIPCDLPAIRSWILTELGVDFSLYEVRVLVMFVSIYRTHKISRKNGFCNLNPPPRRMYYVWCNTLQDLVKKSNEVKKKTPSSSFPLLNKSKSGYRENSQSSDASVTSFPIIVTKNDSFSSDIHRCNSDPTSDRISRLESDDEDDKAHISDEASAMQRITEFRAKTANVMREKSRAKMYGTIDYTPHESPASSPMKPSKLLCAPSFNDHVDTELFGGLTSLDTILRPDENGDPIPRPKTAIAKEKIRFQRESNYVKKEVFRILRV